MIKPCLLATVILSCLASTSMAATLRYCSLTYLTSDPLGGAEITPITCTTATIRTKCTGGLNPQCLFSLKSYSYICCFQIATVTFPTPEPGSTYATLTPGNIGVTSTPQNMKPICPNGALSFGGGSSALTCNMTNLNNAGCPSTYSCVKAANVYDFYGTTLYTGDDIGAAQTPNLCCKASTISSYSNVFSEALLTPSIVPVAPTAGIVSLRLPAATSGTPGARDVYLGDDYSYMDNQLTKAPDSITLFSRIISAPSSATADPPGRYHVLFFDTQNNKDCLFVGNIPGDGTYTIKIGTGPIVSASAKTQYAGVQVFYDSASSSYKLEQAPQTTYHQPLNTVGHKYALLVFQTTTLLDFGTATTTVADSTKILLGRGSFGDFDPAGRFTTVTAFLNGKGKLLGSPVAGSYYTFKN